MEKVGWPVVLPGYMGPSTSPLFAQDDKGKRRREERPALQIDYLVVVAVGVEVGVDVA